MFKRGGLRRGGITELLGKPSIPDHGDVRVVRTHTFDGLHIEELAWRLPYGPETQAVFLKPAAQPKDHGRPLPAVLALHDHGGIKYFGKRKIVRTVDRLHPFIRDHQQSYYGGVGWANELAKRGYAVLVHDVFPFGSRRVLAADVPGHVVERMMTPPLQIREVEPDDVRDLPNRGAYDVPEDEPVSAIQAYNAFAAQHESIVAKSLFSAGLTWPGVFLAEDQYALGYLCSRDDVDNTRIGCCGLSGGGLRTDYLAGLDDRIACAVAAGFMSTWRDFVLNVSYTHTWMMYIPLVSRLLDFPEILGSRAPLPSLVLSTRDNPLFSLDEVKRAGEMLEETYRKAGHAESFRLSIHDGPHKFDIPMQTEAFEWFDRWLKP